MPLDDCVEFWGILRARGGSSYVVDGQKDTERYSPRTRR